MKLIFFYSSEECEYSHKMWKIMENEQILPMFEKYNILDIDSDKIMQLELQMVPAIIIIDDDTGRKSKVEAIRAFQWLEKMVTNRRHNSMMSTNANRVKILQRNIELNKNSMVSNFSQEEMSGFSDNYTYLLTDLPQAKTFVALGADNQAIVTIPEQGKVKKEEMNRIIKNNQQMREAQDKILEKESEQSRLEAIYDNKNNTRFNGR